MCSFRFSVLGALRAWSGESELDLGPVRQQAVLSTLVFNPNRLVTAGEILQAVWGDEPPSTGRKVVAPYIYRLRRTLETDGETPILSRREGYLLRLDEDRVDVAGFERTVRAAGTAEARGDLVEAAGLLTRALESWSGEPLAGIPGPFAAARRRYLVERGLAVRERRIGLDLRLGRHADVVAELSALLSRHPLRERLAVLLMTGLYRCGRQAEALAVFQRTRAGLVEELGIEPGADLRGLHTAILRGDPVLAESAPRRAAVVTRPTIAGVCTLPAEPPVFTGRADTLARLLTAPPAVHVVEGMAGIGKTALAVRAAGLLSERCPDARLYVDLGGHAGPAEALGRLLADLGAPVPQSLEERVALWRDRTTNLRMVLVLDDALDAAQIDPLLPRSAGCVVIVTSRYRLVGLAADTRSSLGVLSAAQATEMFTGLARRPVEPNLAREIAAGCGRLPLALRFAADRLGDQPADLLRRLCTPGWLLSELRAGGRDLARALDSAAVRLTPRQRRLLTVLAYAPVVHFDRYLAATLAELPVDVAGRELRRIRDAGLLLPVVAGRYRVHELVRDHLRSTVDEATSASTESAATSRTLGFYLDGSGRALSVLSGQDQVVPDLADVPGEVPPMDDVEAALTWLSTERRNLPAVINRAIQVGYVFHAAELSHAWAPYFEREPAPVS
ncbi:AfsR/SARP family transcriptional regulator [Amycolatopsis suaedae]|uniref:OmpR/PhoB-type domain-containing protein n=1 Tax=Amycolatopsis suaedae TaxID=2510978 RepID=A0A4Q7J2K5_9PSEU|nr:AfsR/SARP family transcriptional regulator [Amycolatopsis suaedae]RZQ60822.1 hypothetical protein EWH70_27355 [Amycolatopsis suaedae]